MLEPGVEWVDILDGNGRLVRRELARHNYLSTSCIHGEHSYCAAGRIQGEPGVLFYRSKKPSVCKFGGEDCICRCHCRPAQVGDKVVCRRHMDTWPCEDGWSKYSIEEAIAMGNVEAPLGDTYETAEAVRLDGGRVQP